MDFSRDRDNPLDCDALIVDETSMLDIFLAYSLVKALPDGASLLLIGDSDQLPSVGPGSVLKDLIDSGQIPVVKLTQVFRQATQSAIVTSAHQINRGQFPQLEPISHSPQTDRGRHSQALDFKSRERVTACGTTEELNRSMGFKQYAIWSNSLSLVWVLFPLRTCKCFVR